jgi:hypothetical protein
MDRWQLPCDPLIALQSGDPAPFEHFVRTHARTLIAYFRQRGATPGRSEDLAQVVFRYADAAGEVTPASNINGSLNNIAGICNRQRNVVGLMPHPERATEAQLGSADGRVILASAVKALASLSR